MTQLYLGISTIQIVFVKRPRPRSRRRAGLVESGGVFISLVIYHVLASSRSLGIMVNLFMTRSATALLIARFYKCFFSVFLL
jgi:hypothetical protein